MTPSELVRRLLTDSADADGAECTAYELTRPFIGRISSEEAPRGRDARKALEGWHPDRRG